MTMDQKSWGIRRNIKIEDVLTPQELISQVSILKHTVYEKFNLRLPAQNGICT